MTQSSCLLQDLGWDTLEKRCTKQLAITMYKVVNDYFPLRLQEHFRTTSQVHTYNLRDSAHNLFIPRPLSEAGKRSLHSVSRCYSMEQPLNYYKNPDQCYWLQRISADIVIPFGYNLNALFS